MKITTLFFPLVQILSKKLLTVYVKNKVSGTTFTYFYFLNYLEENLYFDHEIINEEYIIESLEITPLIETYFPDIYNAIQNDLIIWISKKHVTKHQKK